jgi:demethylmenaquinone methyltransferase/2-methoxy-6-polyprenyl-1,4-benzoquinol methylase
MHGPGDVRFFDRLASVYDLLAPPTDPGPIRAGLARAERQVERVVDLAGGAGRGTRDLDAEALVVDAAPAMCRRAARRGVPVVTGDAARLPLRDASVDAVVVLDALHHLPDVDAALGEVARVLRPGGVLVVREFDPDTLRGRALVAAERLVGFDSTFRSPDTVADAVAAAGLGPSVLDRGFAYTVVGRQT